MEYKPTSASAIEFAEGNRLEEWVHLFLCGEGNNKAFSDGLKRALRLYHPPQRMKLSTFYRCCGPEDGMKFQIGADGFHQRVDHIAERYENGDWDMPPLIINQCSNTYELNDGNHRYEALMKLNIEEYWVILWETCPV